MITPASTTAISTSDTTSITIRGCDLIEDVLGKKSFVGMLYFLLTGRDPSLPEESVLNACMACIMEHGINPSTIVARLVSDNVPAEPQVAIAAGLLTVGSVFAGTSEQCAQVLTDLAADVERDGTSAVQDTADRLLESGQPIAGFGHLHHKPDDPRSYRLFEVAREHPIGHKYMDLLLELSAAIDTRKGKHVTINATGAIGALLLDIGLPVQAIRCVSVVARAAGLSAHVLEEKGAPTARALWRAGRDAVPYKQQPPANGAS